VDIRLDDARIVATVRDHGIGFSPRADSPGAGLGLPMIAAVASELHVERAEGGGTRVHIAFSRDGTAA
jgi:signal transduction histidine kinase